MAAKPAAMRGFRLMVLALMAAPLAGCAGYRGAVMAENHLAAGTDAASRQAWQEAEREFAAAAAARPDSAPLEARIGLTYERAGRWREAIPWLERSLKRQPTQPGQVRLALMTSLERAGRTDEAEQVLRDALGAHFNDALTLNNLAYFTADRGQHLETAARLLRRAVRLARGTRDEGIITDSLGWCYYRQGKMDDALRLMTRAARLEGRNPEVLYHLGMVLLAVGDREGAAEKLSAALSLDPGLTAAHEALLEMNGEQPGER